MAVDSVGWRQKNSPGIFHQIGLQNIVLASSMMLYESVLEIIGLPVGEVYVPGKSLLLLFLCKSIPQCSGLHTKESSLELASSLFLRLKNWRLVEASRKFFNTMHQGVQQRLDEQFPGNSPKLSVTRSIRDCASGSNCQLSVCACEFCATSGFSSSFPSQNRSHRWLGDSSAKAADPSFYIQLRISSGMARNSFPQTSERADFIWFHCAERLHAAADERVYCGGGSRIS